MQIHNQLYFVWALHILKEKELFACALVNLIN